MTVASKGKDTAAPSGAGSWKETTPKRFVRKLSSAFIHVVNHGYRYVALEEVAHLLQEARLLPVHDVGPPKGATLDHNGGFQDTPDHGSNTPPEHDDPAAEHAASTNLAGASPNAGPLPPHMAPAIDGTAAVQPLPPLTLQNVQPLLHMDSSGRPPAGSASLPPPMLGLNPDRSTALMATLQQMLVVVHPEAARAAANRLPGDKHKQRQDQQQGSDQHHRHAHHNATGDYPNGAQQQQQHQLMVIIDTRRPDEYRTAHLPGAVNIWPKTARKLPHGIHACEPPLALEALLSDMVDRANLRVLMYDAIGLRSGVLGQKLRLYGFKNLEIMTGSIYRWINEGRPVVGSDGNLHSGNTIRALPHHELAKLTILDSRRAAPWPSCGRACGCLPERSWGGHKHS